MELKEVVTKWTAERDGCTAEIEYEGGINKTFSFRVRRESLCMESPYLFVCGHCRSKESALSTCNAIIDHWISL